MKQVRRRERDVPANGWCQGTGRKVIGSGLDPSAGGRAARCAAAAKDLDNDHAAAAAGARRAVVGRGVRIGCLICRVARRFWTARRRTAWIMSVTSAAAAARSETTVVR